VAKLRWSPLPRPTTRQMPSPNEAQVISDDEFERELAELEGRPAPDSTARGAPLAHEITEAAAPTASQADVAATEGPSPAVSSAGEPAIARRAASYMGLGPYPSVNTQQPQFGASGSHFGGSHKKKAEAKPDPPSGTK